MKDPKTKPPLDVRDIDEEPESMYWEGEDGGSYKEDGHPALYNEGSCD